MPESTDTSIGLREEIVRLGPWHFDVQVTPNISTGIWLDERPEDEVGHMERSHRPFTDQLLGIYPGGLEGRSLLDCACNSGAYLFWGKELGAGECFGFDVREHWIKQARFLQAHRDGPSDGIRFEVRDLYEIPALGLEPFDITFFNGIFYHLPDPITGLKIAADLTSELLIVNTSTQAGMPDGLLAVDEEPTDMLMSGVYGLHWLPTGPEVVARVLEWLGFQETHLLGWRERTRGERGRMVLAASRSAGLIVRPECIDPKLRRAHEPFKALIQAIYPDGLSGRRVLDCACGPGARLFWAKELGARECHGFDANEHSITKARFALAHRSGRLSDVQFDAWALDADPLSDLDSFDITLFSEGLRGFPDPVKAIEAATNATRELMIVCTPTQSDEHGSEAAPDAEAPGWRPSGPDVLAKILAQSGFPHTRVVRWEQRAKPGRGWLEMIGARTADLLEALPAGRPFRVEDGDRTQSRLPA